MTLNSLLPVDRKINLSIRLLLGISVFDGIRLILSSWAGIDPYSTPAHIFLALALILKVFRPLGWVLMLSRLTLSAIPVSAIIWGLSWSGVLLNDQEWGTGLTTQPVAVLLFFELWFVAAGFQWIFWGFQHAVEPHQSAMARAIHFSQWNPYFHYCIGVLIVLLMLAR